MERDPREMALFNDIVLDIVLGHLKVRDLLSCRLTSKFWSKAASSVLRKRSTMIKKISEEDRLMELQECMEKSSDFPFAGLKFDRPWRLNSGDAMGFFQRYGARFTQLHLDISWTTRLQYLAPFIKHLPRLSSLQLGLLFRCSRDLDFPVGQGDGKILDLSSVQVIKISSPSHLVDENVVRELLAAASPSLRIECEDATPDLVGVLKKTGRLQAVTFMKFGEDERCGSNYIYELHRLNMDEHLSTESISLTKLDFTADKYLSMNGLLNILISSQHTLKELHLAGQCPSGEYPWDNLPILAKLTSFSSRTGGDFWPGFLFRGRHGHKFPALKELRLRITDRGVVNGFKDWLLLVPSVTMIDLGGNVDKGGMEDLAQAFPNVIEMRLDYEYYSGHGMSGLRNPFQIWSVREFKSLEKLEIWNFDVKRPGKSYVHMDSFLTGMSVEICENLLKEKKLKLINSPLNRILRVHPNILKLSQLKELVVCVKAGRGFRQLPEDGTPFISMLSVWYALDMMPNLRVKFVYDESSAPSRKDKRDKAVLDVAFKRVKDHIKLEPYLY